ncbi:unnamed protein product [Allacma fusca]|uniref:EGF-like domain-containing protein n=1 Tax=Allacma fusca TaxID=39272 RepID=A0A8J2JI58_9HEXA|nr:unnamed protein product [Allacma fusca]
MTIRNLLQLLMCLLVLSIFQTEAVSLELQRVERSPFGKFGNICGNGSPCDRDANLACQRGVCECSMPAIMIFDPDVSMCLVKADEKCKFSIERNGMDRILHNADPVVMPCVRNASCHLSDGACRCMPGFYSDLRGHCWEQKPMGKACDNDEECMSEQGLVCWDGSCDCNPNEARAPAIYASRHICVGIPGSPCVKSLCELNSNCVDGTCVCPHDFIWSESERRCKASFDKPCVDASFCADGLDCINFRCKCRLFNQVHDIMQHRCMNIVSEPCHKDKDCVPNAICSTSKLCQCKPGFMEFGPGFCRNGYGSQCLRKPKESHYYIEAGSLLGSAYSDFERPRKENEQRQDNLILIKISTNTCDSQRKLTCINGKCDCKRGEEIFDQNLGRCVGLVGILCKMYEHYSCAGNSECIPFINLHKFGLGRCTCKNGFSVNENRTCIENAISVV